MVRIIFIVLSIALLLLAGCVTPPVAQEELLCASPYFEYKKGDCCLDANNNNICDTDEQTEISEGKIITVGKTKAVEVIAQPSTEEKEEEQTLRGILELQGKVVKEYEYFFDIGWDESHWLYHSNLLNVTLFVYFERPRMIPDIPKPLQVIRKNHTNQEYLGGWVNPTNTDEIIWYNLTSSEAEEFKTVNDVVLLYEDVPIEKIVSGGMYLQRDTYEVFLENGVKISFDEYHNFPLKVEGTEYGSYDFVLTEVLFNTVPKQKYQKYTPT